MPLLGWLAVSVYVTAYVWEHSVHSGSELLAMLAIADIANREGLAHPSVATLARYTRMSERTMQRLLPKLVKSGELQVRRNAGPRGAHLFQVVMNGTLPLFKEGDKLSPDKLTGVGGDNGGMRGVTNTPPTGDTAMSPEPVTVKKNRTTGEGVPPSPVAQAFKAYSEGIKRKYNADYPGSGKANGQLANVVGRVGRENVVALVNYYLGHQDPFYGRTKHSLDYLVRDCEKFWLELQASGAAESRAPTHARVALLAADGRVQRDLGEVPAGELLAVAKATALSYAGMIDRLHVKYVAVRQGADRRQFSVEELSR